ncbi:MAG: hypothetical protein EA350_17330 [Gemmatimonadales bacterium]|nr:MAG: hypothetical protein EA350_17330 [Gemmatimonadales bacterium]
MQILAFGSLLLAMAPSAAPVPGALQTHAPAAPDSLVFGFAAPEAMDEVGFRRVEAYRLPAASLGYVLRYAGEGRPGVDVYVYPVIPDGEPLSAELREARAEAEMDQGIEDIRTLAGRESREIESSGDRRTLEVETPDGPMVLHHQRVTYLVDSAPSLESHLFVGALGRAFVKMRSSYPSDRESELEPHLEAFVRAFSLGLEAAGHEGMAGYDHRAARTLGLPDDLPEAFDFRLPNRLRSGWELRGSQPLPGAAGTTAIYGSRQFAMPVQLFLRPFPEGAESPEARDAALAERWAGEQDAWFQEVTEQLGGQGFSARTDAPESLPALEVHTHYGPTMGSHARVVLDHADGRMGATHLALFAVEEVLVVAMIFGPADEDAGLDAVFTNLVDEVALNLLATRPPPGRPPPGR